MVVKLVKLVSGEEFISEIEGNDLENDILNCKNPCKLMPTEKGWTWVPFNPLIKKQQFSIKPKDTIFIVDLDEKIENAYKEQFGGIITNSKLQLFQ